MNGILLLSFWMCAILQLSHSEITFDFYWREYHGLIPDDAISGGLDSDGNKTYIGQVYVHQNGLLTGTIYPGVKKLITSRNGIHRSTLAIKILCGPVRERFQWLPATSEQLHVQTINKHLIEGGTENSRVLHIGRTQYQGELIVGKVCSYNIGKAYLFFPHQDTEIKSESYEILVYDDVYINTRSLI